MVNHPPHYTKGIETFDYISSWDMDFASGNAIKYITRAPYKGTEIQDLEKACWYINARIKKLKEKS